MKSIPLLSLLAAALLGGCAAAPPKAPPPAAEKVVAVIPEPAPKPMPALPAAFTQKGVSVKLDGLWQSPDGEILGVNGTAKNVTASDLRFCQISLAFLDSSGVKLDGAKASTKTLKSAQVWHFRAALEHPSTALYSTIAPEKIIAIPVKTQQGDLASLR